MAGAACATATSARFHEDMTVPDWFDPGHADNVVWRVPPRGYPPNVDLSSTLGALLRVALRHSDVLAMACWMGPTRSRTVDYLPRQRFPSREASSFGEAFTAFVFGHAHIHSSIDVPTGSALCRHV